jgi:addiction module RelE/StbE family toxin
MAKRVIWSKRACNERKEILEYWFKRNGNKNYSKKLAQLFREKIKLISDYNYSGITTDFQDVRMTVCSDYLLFYEVKKEVIEILTVWDSRQDPDKINIK